MKVYRYLRKQELDAILKNNISDIGQEYINDNYKEINSHHYRKNVKYLHFFKNIEDIEKLKKEDFVQPDEYYICEFNIPLYILLPGIGSGYYIGHGFDLPNDTALEFKIPAHKLKSSFLKSYTLDKESKGYEIRELAENTKNLHFTFFQDEQTDITK